MSRQIKKLTHKYEFLKLELEEIDEINSKYNTEWGKLFGKFFVDKHSEMWMNEETGEIRKELPTEEDETSKPQKLDKIKNYIVNYLHTPIPIKVVILMCLI